LKFLNIKLEFQPHPLELEFSTPNQRIFIFYLKEIVEYTELFRSGHVYLTISKLGHKLRKIYSDLIIKALTST